jgi:lysozyme
MPTINSNRANNPDEVPLVGVALIKEFEGCELDAYYDPYTGGLPITIGWGSTRNFDGKPFKITDKITQKEADDLLINQIKTQFIPKLKKIPYWDQMSDKKRGALLSFAYNLGANFYGSPDFKTITQALQSGRWNDVPGALALYRNPGTKVEAGLMRRRKAEGALWST